MFDFTPLQNIAIFVIFILVVVFYIRRFWFWFWKVTKLLTQFDLVLQTTVSTNEVVMEMQQKLNTMKQAIDEIKK